MTAVRARVSDEKAKFQRVLNFCACNIAQSLIADICLCTESLIQSLMRSMGIESIANVIELMFLKLFFTWVLFALLVLLVHLIFLNSAAIIWNKTQKVLQ